MIRIDYVADFMTTCTEKCGKKRKQPIKASVSIPKPSCFSGHISSSQYSWERWVSQCILFICCSHTHQKDLLCFQGQLSRGWGMTLDTEVRWIMVRGVGRVGKGVELSWGEVSWAGLVYWMKWRTHAPSPTHLSTVKLSMISTNGKTVNVDQSLSKMRTQKCLVPLSLT